MSGSVLHNAHPGHNDMTLPANRQDVLRESEVWLRGKPNANAVKNVAGNRVVLLNMEVRGDERQVVGCLVEGVDADGFMLGERQATGRGGQVSAGKYTGNNDWFATGNVPCMVNVSCGSASSASHRHLLFCTLSFRRQACVSRIVLPVTFRTPDPGEKLRNSAHNRDIQSLILHKTGGFRHLAVQSPGNMKLQRQYELHDISKHQRAVRASRPVAALPVSRPAFAVVSIPLGLRAALRATCCTARHRYSVTNAELIGVGKARSGVLRFQITKTKDIPCSTRS